MMNEQKMFRSLSSMNFLQNFNGPALDAEIDSAKQQQNDIAGGTTIPLACFQSLVEGKGQAKLNRYYFNSRTRMCEKFIYSGKGGNQVCLKKFF